MSDPDKRRKTSFPKEDEVIRYVVLNPPVVPLHVRDDRQRKNGRSSLDAIGLWEIVRRRGDHYDLVEWRGDRGLLNVPVCWTLPYEARRAG